MMYSAMHVTTVFPRFFATLNCTWQSQEALHGTSDRIVCNSASSYTLSKAVLSVSMVTYVQTPKMDVSCYLLPQNSWRFSTDSGTDSKKDRPEALSHHMHFASKPSPCSGRASCCAASSCHPCSAGDASGFLSTPCFRCSGSSVKVVHGPT